MKKTTSALVVALSLMSASAFAAQSDFYAGVNVGQARTSIDNATLSSSSDEAYSILGGYTFTKNVAAEVQYNVLGTIKDSSATPQSAKIAGYSAVAVGTLPLTGQFSGFAKLGLATTTLELPAGGGTISNTGVTYGVGGQYDITQDYAARVEYSRYQLSTLSSGTQGTTGVLSVGLIAKF